MSDRALWALMQRIETLRYRAERLETAAARWPSPWRDLALRIAGRWRKVADEIYALRGSRAAEFRDSRARFGGQADSA